MVRALLLSEKNDDDDNNKTKHRNAKVIIFCGSVHFCLEMTLLQHVRNPLFDTGSPFGQFLALGWHNATFVLYYNIQTSTTIPK